MEEWASRGSFIEIDGRNLFVIDLGKAQDCVCILHGYPSASYDYYHVLEHFTRQFRVVVFDQLGFGLSDKPKDYSYSLIEQAEVALRLWERLGVKRIHLAAHDYGTSVATEIVARSNKRLAGNLDFRSVVLCNGSIHIELSQLRPIQRLLRNKWTGPIAARLSTRNTFIRNMRKLWFDPAKVDMDELNVLWQMLEHNNGRAVIHPVTQYITERYRYWHRWIGALRETAVPVHIVWARNDPVAVAAIAQALHAEIPGSTLRWLEQTGHYPMLERPKEWAEAVLNCLKL